jgi:hypothetical protein
MGWLLRAEKPTFENQENFRGRRGLTRNTRSYYLYMLKPEGEDSVLISGQKFVSFKKKYLDLRGSRGASVSYYSYTNSKFIQIKYDVT